MNKFLPRKSKSGKFTIYHRDKCPFMNPMVFKGEIPLDHQGINPWFFTTSDGFRTNLGDMRGYPMAYSPGFPSAEEAMVAAEWWEAEKDTTYAERTFSFDDIQTVNL